VFHDALRARDHRQAVPPGAVLGEQLALVGRARLLTEELADDGEVVLLDRRVAHDQRFQWTRAREAVRSAGLKSVPIV
jgi:hypothetical protein